MPLRLRVRTLILKKWSFSMRQLDNVEACESAEGGAGGGSLGRDDLAAAAAAAISAAAAFSCTSRIVRLRARA